MEILRVFPKRTNFTPVDSMVRFGFQSLSLPKFDEIHISVIFSWDLMKADSMQKHWSKFGIVKVGGPATGYRCDVEFVPGRYIKKGYTITTRGCKFNCPWCLVPKIEGQFKELKTVHSGNIIQDNNILLSSKKHLRKVFRMLRGQKNIQFKGGLDVRLLDDWHIEELRSLKISELWLALDSWDRADYFKQGCEKLLKAGFKRRQIRCYVLAGFNAEDIQSSERRLKFAWECGALPYVQAYQPYTQNKRLFGMLDRQDNIFIRRWSRPPIIKSMMKGK